MHGGLRQSDGPTYFVSVSFVPRTGYLHAFPTRRSSDLTTLFRSEQCINTILHELNPLFRSEERRVGKECRSEERFSRNAETDLVCRLLLEKKKQTAATPPDNLNDGLRVAEQQRQEARGA